MPELTEEDERYNPIVSAVFMQCSLVSVNEEPMPGEKRGGVVG